MQKYTTCTGETNFSHCWSFLSFSFAIPFLFIILISISLERPTNIGFSWKNIGRCIFPIFFNVQHYHVQRQYAASRKIQNFPYENSNSSKDFFSFFSMTKIGNFQMRFASAILFQAPGWGWASSSRNEFNSYVFYSSEKWALSSRSWFLNNADETLFLVNWKVRSFYVNSLTDWLQRLEKEKSTLFSFQYFNDFFMTLMNASCSSFSM